MRAPAVVGTLFWCLASTPARADDVFVTGARPGPIAPRHDADGGVTVLSGEDVRQPGGTVGDALRRAPGVQLTDTGGLVTATVRGASASELPVYLAGIRINDEVSGVADLSTVPLWGLERIEVYRGGAPDAADRLGIGGAVFLEPRRPRRAQGGAGAEIGSYGARSLRLFGGPARGWLASFEASSATNDFPYVDDRGTRFTTADDVVRRRANADQSSRSLWLMGHEELGGGTLDLVASSYAREAGVPGLGVVPALHARVSQERRLLGVRTTAACAGEGRCALSLSTAWVRAASTYDDPGAELGLGATRLTQAGERVEERAHVRWDVTDRATVAPDLAVARESLVLEGGPGLRAARLFSRVGVAAEARLGARLRARALVAGECHGTSTSDARLCDTSVITPRVSARVGGHALHVEAVLGRYARVPTLGELFGVSGTVRGAADLRPERGASAEVGGRATTRRVHLEVWAFGRLSEDLLAYRQTALGYVRPYNVGRARTMGAETVVQWIPMRWLSLGGALSLLDARDTTPARPQANDLLPYRARLVAAPRVEAVTETPLGRVSGNVRYTYQASRTADPAGLIVLPAQGSLDAGLGVSALDERVTVRARGANLLGERRLDTVGYPLPGRAFYLALEATAP